MEQSVRRYFDWKLTEQFLIENHFFLLHLKCSFKCDLRFDRRCWTVIRRQLWRSCELWFYEFFRLTYFIPVSIVNCNLNNFICDVSMPYSSQVLVIQEQRLLAKILPIQLLWLMLPLICYIIWAIKLMLTLFQMLSEKRLSKIKFTHQVRIVWK